MNIGIYDTEHFETTHTLLKIWDCNDNKIWLFLKRSVADRLKAMPNFDAGKYVWVIEEEKSILFPFRISRYVRKQGIEILFFNTIVYHHIFFALSILFLEKTKTILTIHDAINFFQPKKQAHIKNIVRNIGIELLKKATTAYAVLLRSTAIYVTENFNPGKAIYIIPGGLFEINNTHAKQTHLKLTVPGSIDSSRRSYNQIFELARVFNQNAYRAEIVLLGGFIDDTSVSFVKKEINKVAGKYVSIKFYETDFISQKEYDYQLGTSDFIFSPVSKTFSRPYKHDEIYGVTKCSGVLFDAIRLGKTVLLPAYVPVSEELKNQCFSYNSLEELFHVLIQGDLEKLKQAALNNSALFTLKQVRGRLFTQLEIQETLSG